MRTVKSLAVLHTYWADPICIPVYSTNEPLMTKHSLIVPYHWLCVYYTACYICIDVKCCTIITFWSG